MNVIRAGVVFGAAVWAAATAVFVPLGRFVLGPDNRLPVAVSVGLVVVATFVGVHLFAVGILRRASPVSLERGALLGACACLPGLILDGALYALNSGRYPGLGDPASGAMSAGLLLSYAAALLAAMNAARVTGKAVSFRTTPGGADGASTVPDFASRADAVATHGP